MTADYLFVVLAFTAGILLGIFYFGSLWFVVKKLPESRRPVLLVIGSFVLRLSVTLLGFYLVFGGVWQRILACLIGFIVARTYLIRTLGPSGVKMQREGGRTSANNT